MVMTRDQRGSVSIWMVTSTFVMMVLVGLAVDLGGQVHTQQRARDIAAQAARVGGQKVQSAPAVQGHYLAVNTSAARVAAQQYLAASGIEGTVSVSGGDTITVSVTDSYEPKFLLFLGIQQLDVTGTASARLIRSLGGNEE
jgi:Flp pilus assembly protein TadG